MDTPNTSAGHNFGRTILQDSTAQLGDNYNIDRRTVYQIKNAHFIPVPSGDLVKINDSFDSQPYRDLIACEQNSRSQDDLSWVLETFSNYDAATSHFRRSCLRMKGTCDWLFHHPQFKSWRRGESNILVCVGPST